MTLAKHLERGTTDPEHRTAYDQENLVPRTAVGGEGRGTRALSVVSLSGNYGGNYPDINLLAGSAGECL